MNPVITTPSVLPDWVGVKEFEADTQLVDKIARVFNNCVFGASFIGILGSIGGCSGLLMYASYMAMALAARKIVSGFIGYIGYPAALGLPIYLNSKNVLKLSREQQIKEINAQGFTAENISLYKSGVKYDAIRITHQETYQNGKWSIHALGNCMAMENFISGFAEANFAKKCNTLLINGPSVGDSGGWPTRYQMGAGFETGLTYLEKTVKATHIIMEGLSLGGGMMGEAILNHDFSEGIKNGTKYLSISHVTFSRLSTIASTLVGKIVLPIFYLVGMELDGVGAAKKLSELEIRHIITQHSSKDAIGTDGTIPDDASLGYEMQDKEGRNRFILYSEKITHRNFLNPILNQLNDHIKQFLSTQ